MTTSLFEAIRKNEVKTVEQLAADRSIDVNTPSEDGVMTPLLEAIIHGSEDIAITLLNSNRVDPNISTPDCGTPLMAAIAKRQPRVVTRLLEHKPSVEIWAKKFNGAILNAVDREEYLEKRKSNFSIDLKIPSRFNTALDYAAVTNQEKIVEELFKQSKTNLDKYQHDVCIENALLIAATYGCQESADFLLNRRYTLITHPHLLRCAAASEKYQTQEKDPKKVAKRTADFIERLIAKGANTDEWKYTGENPSIRLMYMLSQLENTPVESLYLPKHKQQAQQLMSLASSANSTKLNDRCYAMIARISYSQYTYGEVKNDADHITACRYWTQISDIKHLHFYDRELLNKNSEKKNAINPLPLWLRGSIYRRNQTLFNSESKINETKHSTSIDNLDKAVDKTLKYLAQRNSETHNWFIAYFLGYSEQDYLARKAVAEKITEYKLNYFHYNDTKYLLSIQDEITNALQKSEIAGRYFFSSHRFADHLRSISTVIKTIPECQAAEKRRADECKTSLFTTPHL